MTRLRCDQEMLTIRRTLTLVWDPSQTHDYGLVFLWLLILEVDSQRYFILRSRSPSSSVLTELDLRVFKSDDEHVAPGTKRHGRHIQSGAERSDPSPRRQSGCTARWGYRDANKVIRAGITP